MGATIADVLAAVDAEHRARAAKWGERRRTLGEWITLLDRELREAEDAWATKAGDEEALGELLQVLTLADAALVQHPVSTPHWGFRIAEGHLHHLHPVARAVDGRLGVAARPVGDWLGAIRLTLHEARFNYYAMANGEPDAREWVAYVAWHAAYCLVAHGLHPRHAAAPTPKLRVSARGTDDVEA